MNPSPYRSPYADTHKPYRGFWIGPAQYGYWEYVHEDYDGPEDGRCGTAKTEIEAYRCVDDWHDDQGHCVKCDREPDSIGFVGEQVICYDCWWSEL